MKLLAIVMCVLLTGCATTVKVPIPIQPQKPSIMPRPDLPVSTLTVKSSYPDIMRAYVASIQIQNNYIDYLTAVAEGIYVN